MAKKSTQQPFNLLYRFEPRKSSIDRVYEFVVLQGRIIVMAVMVVIILAFAYRFPLDKKLNDQINLSNENMKKYDYFIKNNSEKKFNETIYRTKLASNFLNIYNRETKDKSLKPQINIGEFMKIINQINEKDFKDDIIVISESYSVNGDSDTIMTINGFASSFPKAEAFRGKIVEQDKFVELTKMQNLGGTKQGNIQFSLQVIIK